MRDEFQLLIYTNFYFIRSLIKVGPFILIKYPWFIRFLYGKAFDNAYWRGVEYWHRY